MSVYPITWTDDPEADFRRMDYQRYMWEKENVVGTCEYCGEQIIRGEYKNYISDKDGRVWCPSFNCMKAFWRERGELFLLILDSFSREDIEDAMLDEWVGAEEWLLEQAEEKGLLQS